MIKFPFIKEDLFVTSIWLLVEYCSICPTVLLYYCYLWFLCLVYRIKCVECFRNESSNRPHHVCDMQIIVIPVHVSLYVECRPGLVAQTEYYNLYIVFIVILFSPLTILAICNVHVHTK